MSTAEEPANSSRQRALTAIPVILTILATILAGLSSSEMTQSMYFRSLAAQNQSKAGSQWGFFQAKRIRGTTMESGVDLVRALADSPPLSAEQLRTVGDRVESLLRPANSNLADHIQVPRRRLETVLGRQEVSQALKYLSTPDLPAVAERRFDDPPLQDLLRAIQNRETEAKTAAQVIRISVTRIEEALDVAETNAAAFDQACQPITAELRTLERALSEFAAAIRDARNTPSGNSESPHGINQAARVMQDALTGFAIAKQDFTARRYAKEAAYNQESAELFEVLARRNGAESDRHRNRSKNFFYAMLCAQAGVTVASFALARSRKSWFWGVAGSAGILAVIFGAYVYLAL